MIAEVKVPEVGESITEGTLVQWFKQDGDTVRIDDALFELETDKVTLEVPSEYAGKIRVLVPAGQTVSIGQVVATIDTAAAQEASVPIPGVVADQPTMPPDAGVTPPLSTTAASLPTAERGSGPARPPAQATPLEVPQSEGPVISAPAGLPQAQSKVADMDRTGSLSPAVRRMVDEFRLDPTVIPGTGRDGRITKEDVVRHLQAATPSPPQPRAVADPISAPVSPEPSGEPAGASPRQTRRQMSPMRHRIAERLVQAQHTAAILTTFNEADMTNVLAWRDKHKQLFKKQYDISLGFMSFFVKASVDALKKVPQLNAQIQGEEIVENHYYDIGVAISSDRGLVVPVIRDPDKLSFAEIELAIAELAQRVRDKAITLNDLTGGVFTISNGGVFGSLMSTPILNPPQSGILGMHAIKKRPMVVNDQIAVRPMMYLALSYDHRIIDGREAVTFLKRIVECVEDPERMLLEV
jgi:2-oxoglutarate dehydrogenase E2 component (dihydrolipoamide succinyltransferase)